jgi:hypothetical protein
MIKSQATLGLIDHFSTLADPRQAWKVIYPLPEIMLTILAATHASADDFVEIEEWGNENLAFLRSFLAYADGIPSHDALNDLVNALDADVFKSCISSWVATLADAAPTDVEGCECNVVSLDGKTSRRTHARLTNHICFSTPREIGGIDVAEGRREVDGISRRLAEGRQSRCHGKHLVWLIGNDKIIGNEKGALSCQLKRTVHRPAKASGAFRDHVRRALE